MILKIVSPIQHNVLFTKSFSDAISQSQIDIELKQFEERTGMTISRTSGVILGGQGRFDATYFASGGDKFYNRRRK